MTEGPERLPRIGVLWRGDRQAEAPSSRPLSDSTRSTATPWSAKRATARRSTPMGVAAFSSEQISA